MPNPVQLLATRKMPALLVNFTESAQDFARALKFVMPALSFFAFVIATATVGYIILGWTPMDAFYMVIITVFAVGYGEVLPVKSLAAHVWTILVNLSVGRRSYSRWAASSKA